MTEDAFAWDRFADAVMPRIPTRRWGKPEDFAGIAVYAARHINCHTGDFIGVYAFNEGCGFPLQRPRQPSPKHSVYYQRTALKNIQA